jgi:phosphoribosylanthranilate isomerase
VIVKICGITRPGDARDAAAEGADVIGLVFAPSPRMVTVEEAGRIIEAVNGGVQVAGVFMNHPQEEVVRTARRLGLHWIQLHGIETPEFCRGVHEETGAGVIKTITVTTGGFFPEAAGYGAPAVRYLLFDAPKNRPCGRRVPLPVELLEVRPEVDAGFILAGGLTPGTVGMAVRRLRPTGVDVSSGVESAPGIKNRSKVRRFIREARLADENHSE